MARMFTVTHRKKLHVRQSHPKYHGVECEVIYQEGLRALSQVKIYQDAIRYSRRPDTTQFRRNSTFQHMLDNGWWDHKPIEEYRRELLQWSTRLSTARIDYTEAHSRLRNQPIRFVVEDFEGNEVGRFITWDAARYCKLRSGLCSSITSVETE